MGGFIHLISTIFYPLEWIISWIMWACHWVLVRCGMADGSGFAWCLSIIFMTMIVRACIFPLYTKQINAMAKMQAMQPELAKINAKYKGKKDRSIFHRIKRREWAAKKAKPPRLEGLLFPALQRSAL